MKEIAELKEKLGKDGYCVIPQVYPPELIRSALKLTQEWYDRTVEQQSERMPFMNKDQPMVYNLQRKDRTFLDILFRSEVLKALLCHFLNDRWFTSIPDGHPNYILRSYLARSSNHKMPLHIDSFIPYAGPSVFVMQCAIILEDQDEHNGCTMIVPGSHLAEKYADQEAFEYAIPISSRAGDLVLWDSRVWHSANANESGLTRWSLIATFQRWWLKQAFDIPANLPQEIYDSLSDSEKAVLGFCSIPYDDETCGIDMKRSYELLPKRAKDCRR